MVLHFWQEALDFSLSCQSPIKPIIKAKKKIYLRYSLIASQGYKMLMNDSSER